MKKIIIFLFLIVSSIQLFCQNESDVYVESYTKKNGTYVEGHYRTSPNYTNNDNYSTKGNTNPYTGKPGWIEPDSYSDITPTNVLGEPINSLYKVDPSWNGNKPIYDELFDNLILNLYDYSKLIVLKNLFNQIEKFTLCQDCKYYYYNPEITYTCYSPSLGVHETKGKYNTTDIVLHGTYKLYSKTGIVLIEKNYKNGIKDGWEYYRNEQNTIYYQVLYQEGKVKLIPILEVNQK